MLIDGMKKRWRIVELSETQEQAAGEIARKLSLEPVVGRLLAARGLCEADAASEFMNPKLLDLHEPGLMAGCDRAAERIVEAVKTEQRVVIYGDYDVDGISGAAILWHVLKAIGGDVKTYIPHRIDEGYGLNEEAVKQICEESGEGDKPLIITVDCGITATGPAGIAKAVGVDLIITDHHEFEEEELPDAYALVHPRLTGENGKAYPFGELCGAAVAFKLAWRVAVTHCGSERLPAELSEILRDAISLAALGTIADVVPLRGENRLIAAGGLKHIKRTQLTGLNALIDVSRLREEKVDSYHVGFVLGPRINACGRMGHAGDALKLLTDASEGEAVEIAQMLTAENTRRKETQDAIFEQAKVMVEEAGYDQPGVRAIVLDHAGWHAGVVGIVASRLVETYCRPTVLLCHNSDGLAAGSARSVQGFSMYEALARCEEHLISYGGHAMAAGMKLRIEDVDAFRERMIAHAGEKLTVEDLVQTVDVDASCLMSELTDLAAEQIGKLAPFGCENRSPVMYLKGLRVAQPARRMGVGGKHLQLTLEDEGKFMRAVGWNMGDVADVVRAGMDVDVAAHVKVNHWQGRRNVEMVVEDLRIAD